MDDETPGDDPIDLSTSRLEAFSDGFFAVIITILALELRPPEGDTFTALRHAFPNLAIYVLSFAFLAIYWNNHHHLLRATTRINGGVMWSNMFLLLWLSLIPVVTEWLKEFPKATAPVASFGIVALGAAFAYSVLVRAIIRANGKDSPVATAIASDVKGKVSIAMYAAGVGVALIPGDVSKWFAFALYVAVAVMWIVPDTRFLRTAT
jgi:uncharacterized membrane protein